MNYAKLIGYRAGQRTALALTTIFCLLSVGFSQSVTLSNKSGPPTTSILVSGTGFAADAEIELYFDTTEIALVNANSSGAFSKIKIQVPASALPGEHWVSAEQTSTGTGVQAAFRVNTNWVEQGFNAAGTNSNPYENVLNPDNVSGIGLLWAHNFVPYVNTSLAVVNGMVPSAP